MATSASAPILDLQKERTFFLIMALAVMATALAGFGFFFAIGASSFHSPWWVHVHALSMATWVLLYVTQNYLVWRGDIARHRMLGPLAACWAGWIVLLGFAVTAMDVKTGRVPPLFEPNYFLAMDWLNMVSFAILAWSAVRLRGYSDWHKRLMLGAMINLLSVAWGRLVLPFWGNQQGMWLIMCILLGYFAVGMAWDKRNLGKVHPAYLWGAASILVWIPLSFAIHTLPPVVSLTAWLQG